MSIHVEPYFHSHAHNICAVSGIQRSVVYFYRGGGLHWKLKSPTSSWVSLINPILPHEHSSSYKRVVWKVWKGPAFQCQKSSAACLGYFCYHDGKSDISITERTLHGDKVSLAGPPLKALPQEEKPQFPCGRACCFQAWDGFCCTFAA